MKNDLENLGRRLVGSWSTDATHPAMPGTIIFGSSQFEWLDGKQFLICQTHYDHPDFPDAISIIGDSGKAQLSHDDVNWDDDLEVAYHRAS